MPYDENGRCLCASCRADRADDWEGEEDYGEEDAYGPGPEDTREDVPSALPSFRPLLNLLAVPRTRWSAEVELVGIGYTRAGRVLGCEVEGYGYGGPSGGIVATSDATVDAEVKLSRMRDGDAGHAARCCEAYSLLRGAGAVADLSCGHHVHIDARELAEAGTDKATATVVAAAALGAVCDKTLTALAASGYSMHREEAGNSYGGSWNVSPYVMSDRYKMHGSRLQSALLGYGDARTATVEYRLPNGTLYPERAHAHVAIAIGLVDLAKRAVLHGEADALAAVASARERLQGWSGDRYGIGDPDGYSEADGAAFLARNLRLHRDSFAALHLAAKDAPTNKQHRDIWAIAAQGK